jgi:phosphohistidine phosphatase SixA
VAAALAAHKKARSVALVGHEPDLGQLAAWLIGATAPLTFRKGGVARVDIDVEALPAQRAGQLVWLATPAMLRALSGDDD